MIKFKKLICTFLFWIKSIPTRNKSNKTTIGNKVFPIFFNVLFSQLNYFAKRKCILQSNGHAACIIKDKDQILTAFCDITPIILHKQDDTTSGKEDLHEASPITL